MSTKITNCIEIFVIWDFFPDMNLFLFVMPPVMVEFSTCLTIEFSWCLECSHGCMAWTGGAWAHSRGGAPVLSTKVEDVWLPIWTVWGLLVRKSKAICFIEEMELNAELNVFLFKMKMCEDWVKGSGFITTSISIEILITVRWFYFDACKHPNWLSIFLLGFDYSIENLPDIHPC